MRITTQFVPMIAIAGTLFVFNLWDSPIPAPDSTTPESTLTPASTQPNVVSAAPTAMALKDQPSSPAAATPTTIAAHSASASSTASAIFPDVQADPYATDIDAAYQLGIVAGFDDGSFQPQARVTREGAITLVVNLLTQEFPTPPLAAVSSNSAQLSPTPFPDVARDRWSVSTIDTAQAMALVQGDDLGQFRPTATVTRAELMAMLQGAIAYAHQTTGRPLPSAQASAIFEDVDGHWVAPILGNLAVFCPAIANPLSDDNRTFDPDAPALRNYTASAAVQTYDCLNAIAP
ncbi:MAG: S-layer homology domain-containing protein [Cyanobacteria bacterium P01_A01_bin.123]